MKTTLNKIRANAPCVTGWKKLLRHLGKTKADDEPLNISTVLESNGLDDALWCLRAVEGWDKEIRLLAVSYARKVQHLMTDKRSLDALDVAERFAKMDSTIEDLEAARAAAGGAAEAAREAAWAALAAARAAAAEAARAAWAAAWAAREAAEAAAGVVWATAEGAWEEQTTMLLELCRHMEYDHQP